MTSGPSADDPRDGYIERCLFRPLARPVTRRLLSTAVSPNAVTVTGAAAGIAGGLLIGSAGAGGVLAGVACLALSGVLDCADGELARRRGMVSRVGHLLDIAGDLAVNVAVLAGIARRLLRTGAVPDWPVLLTLGLGVAGAFAVITWSDASASRRLGIPRWENAVLHGVLSPLSTRDWHVFPVAFALAGRLDLLLLGAAVGAHVFWAAALVLLLRVRRAAQVQGSAARVRQ